MKIVRDFVEYKFEHQTFAHHLLMIEDGSTKNLLSAANIYLKQNASTSEQTSDRYSSQIKRFLKFLIEQRGDRKLDHNIWRQATAADIRKWQGAQVSQRDEQNLIKPNDNTIRSNAKIVHQFYCWASEAGFPVAFNTKTKDWKFKYKDESKLINIISMISGSHADHANIDLGGKNTRKQSKSEMLSMSDEDIGRLMNAYKDAVYPAILMLSLATGMREGGCVTFPYIGSGVNGHIRTFPDIKNELKNGDTAKTFSFTVTEKRSKERTLQVNMAAWQSICKAYLPLFYERKRRFEKKFPGENANAHFFLKKNGEPVTATNVSDQTYLAKLRIFKSDNTPFPWTFHSARAWYATSFIIRHLSVKEINNMHYDAAVEEQLRKQLGHKDIKTTYMHYIRQASLVLALREGQIDYTLGKDFAFFDSLRA
ncbi:MAG: site-specific integrase [Paraglaciecola polaris]|uniref:site-specific integrase n=1 Tax=Paraglaciecola polaris TaxID=222814 RepID=UPI0030033DD2